MSKLLFAGILIVFNCFAQSSKEQNQEIDKIFDILEVTKFVNSVKKIKTYKSPGEINELEYEMKMFFDKIGFWYYFDPVDYRNGLQRNIRASFDLEKLQAIKKSFKNPFLPKVVKNLTLYRDVFGEYHNIILGEYTPEALRKSRVLLVQNVYNILGMSVQKEMFDKRISELVGGGLVTVPMLGRKDDVAIIDTRELEKRQKNIETFTILLIGESLKNFRHYELREFIRQINTDKDLMKFTQLFVNFHFMYLYNYMIKVEADKLRQLKALKPSL